MDSIDKLRQEIIESETFCFYPYLEMSTNPSGHIKPCCYYTDVLFRVPESKDYTNSISIIKGDTLEEAWNSEAMQFVRKELHQGRPVKNCQACIRDGAASMRVRSIKEYKNNEQVLELVERTIKNDYKAEHTPLRLELKPSNLCNLKCVMCNSYDSSQVAKELKELAEKYTGIEVDAGRYIKITPEQPGINENNLAFGDVDLPDWSDNEEIWSAVKKMIPGLETLSFAGGEPTLLPFVEKTLRYCVDTGHSKHIKIFLSSNFTNINSKFLELLTHFDKVELIASIDGVGKVNDYCRYPSKWSQISTNYKKVKDMMSVSSNIKSFVNITVNLLNVMNLDQLLFFIDDHAQTRPYFKEWPFNINLIFYPTDQRIDSLPPELRKIAIDRLQNYKANSFILKEFPELGTKIDLVINELSKSYTQTEKDNLEEFIMRVSLINEHRGIKIRDYIPDLATLFEHE